MRLGSGMRVATHRKSPKRSSLASGGALRGVCAAVALAASLTLCADRACAADGRGSGGSVLTGHFLAAGVMAPRVASPYSFASGYATTPFAVVPILAQDVAWKSDSPARNLATLAAFGHREERHHDFTERLASAAQSVLSRIPSCVCFDREGIGLTVDF